MAKPSTEIYREYQRRLHKLLGVYLALWSWKNDVDGVWLSRESLLNFLTTKALGRERIQDIKQDIIEFWPKVAITRSSNKKQISGIYFFRRSIIPDNFFKEERQSIGQSLRLFHRAGVKYGIPEIPPDEKMLIEMTLLVQGLSNLQTGVS